MFGIDLGITVSSVTLVAQVDESGIPYKKPRAIDYQILFGNQKVKDDWKRVVSMADSIVDSISNIARSVQANKFQVELLVSIEEPIYSFRTRNPRSYLNLGCLYALVRNKLSVRGFNVYSINPLSAKAMAKGIFKTKRLSGILCKKGRLTKTGMIRAYKKVHGEEPSYSTKVGRETLADSYWIAMTGLTKKRLGVE